MHIHFLPEYEKILHVTQHLWEGDTECVWSDYIILYYGPAESTSTTLNATSMDRSVKSMEEAQALFGGGKLRSPTYIPDGLSFKGIKVTTGADKRVYSFYSDNEHVLEITQTIIPIEVANAIETSTPPEHPEVQLIKTTNQDGRTVWVAQRKSGDVFLTVITTLSQEDTLSVIEGLR